MNDSLGHDRLVELFREQLDNAVLFDDDVFREQTVNLAARLMAATDQAAVSTAVHELAERNYTTDYTLSVLNGAATIWMRWVTWDVSLSQSGVHARRFVDFTFSARSLLRHLNSDATDM